ncbi:hypothetical protein Tco_1017880 [Tanacetum coccineum]|uniref:Uncharacterized protein n=1 Tax=Tanacetum coccineum TaxID=301880 RepID=A0ABQ5FSX9_9ASTR
MYTTNATTSRQITEVAWYVSTTSFTLRVLSNNDLKGSRTEEGFKRAFATLFGQDLETFTGTMFLYMDQLQKQLDNEEFQEIGFSLLLKYPDTVLRCSSVTALFGMMKYVDLLRDNILQYTRSICQNSVDSLNQHMESVKTDVDCSVFIESNGTKSKEQDTSSTSGNDAHVDDADIRPIHDEEPMAEVQTTADDNVYAIGQQIHERPEFIMKESVDLC